MAKNFLIGGPTTPANLDHMKSEKTRIVEKWDKTGLLDGLKGIVKENMAQLFENQYNALLDENTKDDIKEDS